MCLSKFTSVLTGNTETTSLNIKLQFSPSKGFYLTLPADEIKGTQASLPDIFTNVVKKKKHYCFVTLELVSLIEAVTNGIVLSHIIEPEKQKLQYNSRMEESLAEVYLMSDR